MKSDPGRKNCMHRSSESRLNLIYPRSSVRLGLLKYRQHEAVWPVEAGTSAGTA